MTSHTDKLSAGNNRAACMREHRKRMRLEQYICYNVPKRTMLNAERHHDYSKCKAQEKIKSI
jgi:hypothetical protein